MSTLKIQVRIHLMTEEIQYFILITAILVIPKVLIRYRVPTGLTAMGIGLISALTLQWFSGSQTVNILATLGITSLFLFAGLEVDYYELKKDAGVLLKHLATTSLIVIVVCFALSMALDLSVRASIVLALGLTTPSTGFILNSLSSFNFDDTQRYWIRSKAIAAEIVALIVLFFVLQSDSIGKLSYSLLILIALIAVLPFLFRYFLRVVAPFAKDSEVTFLILLALLCGVLTKKLGTYYLIGAFIVGVVASQFRHFIRTENSDKMLYSIGFFSSLFIPFYFFNAGQALGASHLSWTGLAYGVLFLLIFVPLRYFSVIGSIKLFLQECWGSRKQLSVSLMPTLIFGLVIASILREKFNVNPDITNGLVIYTVISSIIPSFILSQAPPEEYDTTFVSSKKHDFKNSPQITVE